MEKIGRHLSFVLHICFCLGRPRNLIDELCKLPDQERENQLKLLPYSRPGNHHCGIPTAGPFHKRQDTSQFM